MRSTSLYNIYTISMISAECYYCYLFIFRHGTACEVYVSVFVYTFYVYCIYIYKLGYIGKLPMYRSNSIHTCIHSFFYAYYKTPLSHIVVLITSTHRKLPPYLLLDPIAS